MASTVNDDGTTSPTRVGKTLSSCSSSFLSQRLVVVYYYYSITSRVEFFVINAAAVAVISLTRPDTATITSSKQVHQIVVLTIHPHPKQLLLTPSIDISHLPASFIADATVVGVVELSLLLLLVLWVLLRSLLLLLLLLFSFMSCHDLTLFVVCLLSSCMLLYHRMFVIGSTFGHHCHFTVQSEYFI